LPECPARDSNPEPTDSKAPASVTSLVSLSFTVFSNCWVGGVSGGV